MAEVFSFPQPSLPVQPTIETVKVDETPVLKVEAQPKPSLIDQIGMSNP